ncbi:alpha/beta fold hydrolase [Nocardioides sp.]|uniref:alpha/beta fold hydrolase n=1 Tax=Nocardioides sp. TaxID=35761 RepID=UPI0026251F6B|nr:alpha/beta fold hydrolase [Nocardioides sp.]
MTETASGGTAAVTSTLTRNDGTTFRQFSVDGDVRPEAPVVVLSPAMGMPAGYYLTVLDALAAAGLHGVAYEQRGHEKGGQPAGWRRNFGYAELVEDLVQVIAQARSAHPDSPVIVLGHSLGGQVSVAAIGEHPGLYDGLILMASSTPHWRHWSRKILAAGVLFPTIANVLGHFPGDRLKFAGREARRMMTQWGTLARSGRLPLGEDGLGAVDVPVLAVSIEGDWLGVPSAVDALCAKLPASTALRVHVDEEGIDHFKWARRPASVMGSITDWVATQPAFSR